MNTDADAAGHDVAQRLDRLPVTVLHAAAIALCAAGFMFDLLEIALGSVLSAVFSTPPHIVAPHKLSLLLSSVYMGAIVGAPALGWWADRYGRRQTLLGIQIWLALMSFGAATSRDVNSLTVYRALSGIALGAYPPLVIAFLTDIVPPRRRGMLIFLTVGIASVGPVIGVFFIHSLQLHPQSGLEPWQWGFVLGGSGAAICGGLMCALPESPRWLLSKGLYVKAELACRRFEVSRTILGDARTQSVLPRQPESLFGCPSQLDARQGQRRWPLIAVLYLLSPWSTVAFPLLTGALLTQKGVRLSDALLYVGLSNFGPLAGAFVSANFVDRLDRRLVLSVCAIAMLASGAIFIAALSPAWLIIASISFNLAAFIYISALNVYGAELFPTPSRAASVSGAWALNRLGAAIAPLVLLPLLHDVGPGAMYAVIATALGLSVVLLALAPAGRQRLSVA